jgi:hypothetical protein
MCSSTLSLDLGTRRGWGPSVTPRPLSTPGKDPVPIVQEAGWTPGPVWTGEKNLAHQDSIPGPSSPQIVAIPTELLGPPLSRSPHHNVFIACTGRTLQLKSPARHTFDTPPIWNGLKQLERCFIATAFQFCCRIHGVLLGRFKRARGTETEWDTSSSGVRST